MRRRLTTLSIAGTTLAAAVLAAGLSGCANEEDASAQEEAATTTATSVAEEVLPATEAVIDMGAPGEFAMRPQPAELDAGEVTFTVANDGTIEHEVLIMRSDLDSGDLPVDANGAAIERDLVTPMGAGHDGDYHGLHLKAGRQEELSLDLPAGEYVLVCNLPGHYQAGMHANLTVS
jgi:uncharacterized cupredoxin-like copper-binding protein